MANTINKEEPYKLVENLINAINDTSLTDPNRKFHKLYVTISSEFKNIDKVDYLAFIIYGLPGHKFEILQNIFGIGDVEQDLFTDFVNEIKNNAIKGIDDEDFDEEFSTKIVEHIRLCCFQRSFMEKNAEKALKISKEANDLANTAKSVSDKAAKSARDTEDIKSKIYSEFIAILGIFTAISFMSMGSLQVLGDLFKDVKDPTSASVGYALIVGGIYISIMYVFVIIMFVGMKKVVGNGDKYKFSFGVCALVLITITALFGTGLFITGHVVPGLMILTICAVGLIVSFLAIHPMATESK
ncbi:hypothetical protein LKF67_2575 [Lactococcus lactis subsp. lactis]|uniref:hypothetical protein n=1 Tax=Lactococcus lactis TaxID=1358 RepID=UPI00071C3BF9|nr:hypothetical protein [Lactococcus lactis]KST87674.1 hypothetical protein LKF67_2575 [Lactococcus lactis subsp. lactis]